MKPVGQLEYIRSRVDGKLYPCAVCATDPREGASPLVLEVSPGAISDLPAAIARVEEMARIAARRGLSCVVMRPTGRGPGSVYQNYGEIDVLDAIAHACANYVIDRDRITVTGSSMGGAAVWYLVSHYPDLFAGAAPFCGYCDYRLWEKPGGLTFHMHPWEEPSWQARSAALLVENLEHTSVWVIHGAWDRAVGGGVPVEHSRQMDRLMSERGFAHRYTEVPATGHGSRTPELLEEVVPWLLAQRKGRSPEHVALATYTLRHSTSYWVTIEQLAGYGQRGLVDATISPTELAVRTENVRALSLGPVDAPGPLRLLIDGQDLGRVDLATQRSYRSGGAWRIGEAPPGEKRPGCSGPIADLFFEQTILVPGTAGSDEETFHANWVATQAARYYRSRNGGVHRGGIMGENWVDLPVVPDRELSDEDVAENNLLLYGTYATNAVLARFQGQLPFAFDGKAIHLAGKRYAGERVAALAVFPHPGNPARYVAVHGGVTPDAICWGSHLDMGLMPDYLVYDGGEALDWGFFDNGWQTKS